jgi:GNAT superfamily N-acetyltransferase
MQCEKCGMWYSETNSSDQRQHRLYHDKKVNGFKYNAYKSERRIYQERDLIITAVDMHSNQYEIARALELGIMGHTESRYSSRPFDESELYDQSSKLTVFLLHKNKRTIGILVVELEKLKWDMSWTDYNTDQVIETKKSNQIYWSGRFIWIHKQYRRKGYGRLLVKEALQHLGISINEFGYSSHLSKEGILLAQSISPRFLCTR